MSARQGKEMIPAQPKIYHIVHVDRLASFLSAGRLSSDAAMNHRADAGTTIGMGSIKLRRLTELTLRSHPGLYVGECVPFYFCPRSIMLYLIHCANHPELTYRGGQQPIVHLEADLRATVAWAEREHRRWAFTSSNAGARYFEDWAHLDQLGEIHWNAVAATQWSGSGVDPFVKEAKQAEFLLEQEFPWRLVERIGVCSASIHQQVTTFLLQCGHRPAVEIKRDWYY